MIIAIQYFDKDLLTKIEEIIPAERRFIDNEVYDLGIENLVIFSDNLFEIIFLDYSGIKHDGLFVVSIFNKKADLKDALKRKPPRGSFHGHLSKNNWGSF